MATIMLVGEAPGAKEDELGYPFRGKAGKFLDNLLEVNGIERTSTYITNLVKCRPKGNATPKPKDIHTCTERWLGVEVGMVKPSLIVAMGQQATRYFLDDAAATMEHTHGIPIAREGRIILPVYHPAAGLHNTTLIRAIYDDFAVLGRLVDGGTISEYQVEDKYPSPKYREFPQVVGMNEPIAVDVETVNNKLWSVQVTDTPGEAYFYKTSPELIIPADTSVHTIVHNYLYDAQFISMPNFIDTMVMAYLLGLPQGLKELAHRLCGMEMQSYTDMVNPYRHDKALKYLQDATTRIWQDPRPVESFGWNKKRGKLTTKIRNPQHISRKIRKILADCMDNPQTDPYERWNKIEKSERRQVEESLNVMPDSTIADIPLDQAIYYACRDADATYRVHQAMSPMIKALGLEFILDTDQSILPAVLRMQKLGMPVDIDHFKQLSKQYAGDMIINAQKASSYSVAPFNPGSSIQTAKVVFEELGFKPTRYTSTGLPSTDDNELRKIGHPIIKPILEYRKLAKLKGTYADAIPKWSKDSRIAGRIRTTRTETGRLSMYDPNLQNIPARDTKDIRNGFTTSSGRTLLAFDYSQIEMRLAAHMSQCQSMITLFNEGRDIHTETASQIFSLPLDQASNPKYRYPTKTMGFGVVYGLSEKGLYDQLIEAGMFEWDLLQCRAFIDDYHRLRPELWNWKQETIAYARRKGLVRDLFGRIRYIPELFCPLKNIQSAGERQAVNMPIQASAAGIIKLAMAKIPSELDLLLQIHDELMFETSELDIQRVKNIVTPMMKNAIRLSVPLEINVKEGKRWGEME